MKDNKFDIEELVIRYCEGNVSESEKCDVENWMSESEENSEMVRKMYTLILATDTSLVCDKIDVDAAWMRMKESIDTCAAESKKNKKKRGWMLWMQRVAAVLFLPLLIGTYLLYINQQKRDTSVAQVLEIRATSGMTAKTYLPDSTLVYLNAGSVLRYPSEFTGNKREVELMGEAYFEVAKDPSRRFVIATPQQAKIEVLGTKFNLETIDKTEEVITTLLEGKVPFSYQKGNQPCSVEMLPGQKVVYHRTCGSIEIHKTDGISETAWKDGEIIFNNTPLKEALHLLEKHYNVEFIVKNPAFYQYSFTGTFANQRLEQIMKYFHISSSIHWNYIDTYGTKNQIELY